MKSEPPLCHWVWWCWETCGCLVGVFHNSSPPSSDKAHCRLCLSPCSPPPPAGQVTNRLNWSLQQEAKWIPNTLRHTKSIKKPSGAHSHVCPGTNVLAAADVFFPFFNFTFTVRSRRGVKQGELSNCRALSQVQQAEMHLGCLVLGNVALAST